MDVVDGNGHGHSLSLTKQNFIVCITQKCRHYLGKLRRMIGTANFGVSAIKRFRSDHSLRTIDAI